LLSNLDLEFESALQKDWAGNEPTPPPTPRKLTEIAGFEAIKLDFLKYESGESSTDDEVSPRSNETLTPTPLTLTLTLRSHRRLSMSIQAILILKSR